ncbi:MAG: response regulator transcription factor [Candidatus Omnitrophota bacterium]
MTQKILIVEDDRNIMTGLVDNLEPEGFIVILARDGREALVQAKEKLPDLILLDIMLPKLNGFEVCKELKLQGNKAPIIILSARAQEADKVMGLELGADDYVTKPFSPRELVARVKSVLRRATNAARCEEVLELDGLRIDFRKYMVTKDGLETPLTVAECKILKMLVSNRGEPVSRDTLLAKIWTDERVTTRTVDTHIWSLREKIEKDPGKPVLILTVHRVGYKFAA